MTRPWVLVISGSMGSGKTTVLGEASDILTAAGIPHAGIDLDAIGIGLIPLTAWEDLAARNLSALWDNYVTAGVTRLLIAEAVDTVAKRDRLRVALPSAERIVICRLRARLETMQERVREREPGMLQAAYVARVAELEASLDALSVEDFSVENDRRSVTDVAREMLVRAGWLARPTMEQP